MQKGIGFCVQENGYSIVSVRGILKVFFHTVPRVCVTLVPMTHEACTVLPWRIGRLSSNPSN